MDFGRILAILSKYKWLILICVCVTSVLVLAVVRLLPANWIGSVRLMTLNTSSGGDAPRGEGEGAANAQATARIYMAMVHSKEVVEAAARASGVEAQLKGVVARIEFEQAGQRMFELRYSDTNVGRARAMANALANQLVEANRAHNSAEARRNMEQVEKQLMAAEESLHRLQSRYEQYCLDNKIIPGDFLNQVKDLSHGVETAATSRDAAIARIAQNRARLAVLKAYPDAPQYVEDRPTTASAKETVLEHQIGELDTEIRQLRRRYNDTHPDLAFRLQERDELEQELNTERSKKNPGGRKSVSGPSAAKSFEDAILVDEALIRTEEETITTRNREINRLKRANSRIGDLPTQIAEQVEARSAIVQRLNRAKAEMDAAERQNPLSVLEYCGDTNPPKDATAGRTAKFVGMAAVFALLASTGLGIALESADRRVRTLQQAEQMLPVRVIAAIPQAKAELSPAAQARIVDLQPASPQAEAYRFLGQFVLGPHCQRHKVLMALSAKSGQGNTRVITNLAITLAQAGYRIILVDGNLRNPMIHAVFGIKNDTGLAELLQAGELSNIKDIIRPSGIPGLGVVTSGVPDANPWQLFSSQRLKEAMSLLRTMADYVLIDTPSALAYTDTLSLSTLADAALLCVKVLDPLTGAEHRLGEMFSILNMQILGSVLIDAPQTLIDSYDRSLSQSGVEAPVAALPAQMPERAPVIPAEMPISFEEVTPMSSSAPNDPKRSDYLPAGSAWGEAPDWFAPRSSASAESGSDQKAAPAQSSAAPTTVAARETSGDAVEEFGTAPKSFPRSIHGYSTAAVDAFVRTNAERMEKLKASTQADAARAEEHRARAEQLAIERDRLYARLVETERLHAASAEAEKRASQRIAHLEAELQHTQDRLRGEVESALTTERREQQAILQHERNDAEAAMAEVRRAAAAQMAELERRHDAMASELAHLRAEAAKSQAASTDNSELIRIAERQRERLEAELEAQRSFARSQFDIVITDAKRQADEAALRAEAFYNEQQERIRNLADECETLTARIRKAIEYYVDPLSAPGPAAPASASRPGSSLYEQIGEPAPKTGRDWRRNDWRTG